MTTLNASDVIQNARLNSFHYGLLFWCSFIMMFDGYDLVIYGSVLPHLMTQWTLSPAEAGVLGASSMAGMMLGAVAVGTQADRFGRRRIILSCVALFSLAALCNGFADQPTSFAICRFLTGVGLGGVVPNLVTLLKEMSPAGCRNRLINIMLSFFAVGGLLSGVASVYLIPDFGWQAPFFVAGLSLLSWPVLYKTLPESVEFLIHNDRQQQARSVLLRIAPDNPEIKTALFAVPSASADDGRTALKSLFAGDRTFSTLMLWLSFGMCMLMVYGLNTWLPKMMSNGGYPLGSSIVFLVVMNVGALVGTLISGVMADRWGCRPTLMVLFALAAVSIAALGIKPDAATLHALLLLAGGSTVGCLSVVHTLAADLYPTPMRATGVSMAAAVGRCGAVAGPLLGGLLVSFGLAFEHNFLVFAAPGVVAVIAVMLISKRRVSEVHAAESQVSRAQ